MAPPTNPPPSSGLLGWASSFDAIALILFILYSVRRLELGRRSASEYPHVQPETFEAWKRGRMRRYLVAALACSLKPLLGTIVPYMAFRLGAPYRDVRAIGGIVDVTWILVVAVVAFKNYQSSKTALKLGLSEPIVVPPPPARSEEDGRSQR